MTAFSTKPYQQAVLDSTHKYFERVHEDGDADLEFHRITKGRVGWIGAKLEGFS